MPKNKDTSLLLTTTNRTSSKKHKIALIYLTVIIFMIVSRFKKGKHRGKSVQGKNEFFSKNFTTSSLSGFIKTAFYQAT